MQEFGIYCTESPVSYCQCANYHSSWRSRDRYSCNGTVKTSQLSYRSPRLNAVRIIALFLLKLLLLLLLLLKK